MPDISALTDMILAKMRPHVEEVARQVVRAKELASAPIAPERLPPATQLPEITETVQDIVAALLVAGSNTTLSYDDAVGKLTISSGGGVPDPVDTYYHLTDADGVYLTDADGVYLYEAA